MDVTKVTQGWKVQDKAGMPATAAMLEGAWPGLASIMVAGSKRLDDDVLLDIDH